MEEELRAQRVKYEESSDDVYRRMGEIQDSEPESMADLGAFLDAELEYHDRCRDILANLRRQWPAGQPKHKNRSRSLNAHSFGNGTREESPPPMPEPEHRPAIGSRVKTSDRAPQNGGFRLPTPEERDRKPPLHRTSTAPTSSFEGPTTADRLSRTRSSEQAVLPSSFHRTRPSVHDDENTSRDRYDRYERYERSESPATSFGSLSRSSSNSTLSNVYGNPASARKQPPPPPPAARKRPPPPPPPKKIMS